MSVKYKYRAMNDDSCNFSLSLALKKLKKFNFYLSLRKLH